MDFLVPLPAVPLAPGALVAMGADPQINVPAGHVLLSLLPASLFAVPAGALAGSAVTLSTLYACFGDAFHVTPPGTPNSVHAESVLLRPILATKFEVALQSLIASGLPVVMYSSLSA